MKIIVTGGLGFIGTNLVEFLLLQSHEVLCLDKNSYASNFDYHQTLSDGNASYNLEILDLSSSTSIESIIHNFQPDLVFHLAAESHVDRSIDSPDDFIQSNIIGTYNLLEAIRKYNRLSVKLIHVSTDEVFGSHEDHKFTEITRYDPSSPYSASKAAADHLVRAWSRTYDLNINITNCSNNFGPFQHSEKLIPKVIQCLQKRTEIPVYGNGKNIRDWLFVQDHVLALYEIATNGTKNESYNIGSSNEVSNVSIIDHICSIYDRLVGSQGSKELISFVKDRPGHDFRYSIDATKLMHDTSWKPQSSFETALSQTVDWYLQNPTYLK
jgi:dTDP-glucose 4,6-dehydratase